MNRAFCNSCQKLVPARNVPRDGKVFLVKDCPDCGETTTYISSDAVAYQRKRSIDFDYDYHGCLTNCTHCEHHRNPRFTFVNVTNRCNVNCPICFDNVPGLGFEFEPPIEYFDRVFADLAKFDPKPAVCLFGGEPTVREDLFDIIRMCRSYGMRARVFTNGLKLADEEYCRRLAKTRAELLISYDGANSETYRVLRGTAKVLELKQKAIENVGKLGNVGRRRVTIVSVISKGLNDGVIPELFEFCHSRRQFIGTLYLMPLCHTWDTADWDFDPERITTEGVEALVNDAFPEHEVEFLPLGFVHQFGTLMRSIGKEPLPYGAHPNCESIYFLVSDGEKYVPVGHYLRGSALDLADTFMKLEKRLAEREKKWQTSFTGRVLSALRLKKVALRVRGLGALMFFLTRHVRFGRLLKGRGLAKLPHAVLLPIEIVLRRGTSKAIRRHTNMQGHLRVVVLPLEDNHVLETERLERCPTVQAYYDPEVDQVRYIPLCAWKLHNREILRKIADHYAAAVS